MQDDQTHSSLRTRPSLLFRLRDWEDNASWSEFYALYRKLVYGLARRSGLQHAEAEEVTQDVFKRVAETIESFECDPNRGSFRGWLMNLTRWRISDRMRRAGTIYNVLPSPQYDDRTRTIERIPDDRDDDWDREWRFHILGVALDRVSRKAKPKHYQVFELYSRQQWPVGKLSKEFAINPAAVYLICHRLTKQLKAEAKILQAKFG